MDNEKEKKKREWGETLGNIARMLKALKNPVIFWTAVILVGLFLLIGVIGFFESLIGDVYGGVTNFVKSVFSGPNYVYKVKEEDLIDLCKNLEKMNIDLEGYGFVDEITRKNVTTYQDEEFQNGETPNKGEIISVKSKYLEAYIIAERKSYEVANINYQEDMEIMYNQIQYQEFYVVRAIEETVEEAWNNGNFWDGINRFYEHDRENGVYKKKDTMYPAKEESIEYKTYAQINESDLKEKVKKMITTYYQYKGNSGSMSFSRGVQGGIFSFLSCYSKDTIMAYYFGESLIREMGDLGTNLIRNIDARKEEFANQFNQYENLGTGMIVLEDEKNGGGTYTATIDKEHRYFIVGYELPLLQRFLEIFNPNEKIYMPYAFNLDGWTSKYGKPVEFLLALHMATQAPDFVYQLATSPAVDTKVHVSFFPTNVSSQFVLRDGENDITLDELISAAENNEDNLNRYKAKIPEVEDELNYKYSILGVEVPKYWLNEEEKKEKIQSLSNASSVSDFFEALKSITITETGIYERIYAEEPLIHILGETITYKQLKEAIPNFVEKYEGNSVSATPYITKVVNHWYRNQYFVPQKTDLVGKKEIVMYLVSDLCAITETEDSSMDVEQIKQIETEAELTAYIEGLRAKFKERVVGKDNAEELNDRIDKEIDGTKKDLENKVTGGAYRTTTNTEPFYYELEDVKTTRYSNDEKVNNILKKLSIKEIRDRDIIQIHNPVFEDNSKYIRSWLKEKYYKFDGTTDMKNAEENGNETTIKTLTSERMANGKEYIQGKTALENVVSMLEECKERSNIIYMQRDLEELFNDFEFDLENVEVPAEKVLTNVMPDYKPYTPWPSIYEKQEANCTKMIYKTTEDSDIVAPANGVITKSGNGVIEIEFSDNDKETTTIAGMTLQIKAQQGSISGEKRVGQEVTRGEKIGTAHSKDGMIILKLNLFSMTKQILKVENYMRVEKRDYGTQNEEYRLTDEEKLLLYNLQEKEIDVSEDGWLWWAKEDKATILQRTALMNVVFNKIASPLYPNYKSIESILENLTTAEEADFIGYAKRKRNTKILEEFEKNENAKYAIINAMSGVDITKGTTLIGATRYIGIYEKDQPEGVNIEKVKEEVERIGVKLQIADRVFYITDADYALYLDGILDQKINEVIYVLNQKKYGKGWEEYDKLEEDDLKAFENAKKEIKEYYAEEKFLEGQIVLPGSSEITEVVKSNITTEYKELEDGTKEVTDSFSLTVNSNYMTKFTLTYQKGTEGKIITEVKLKAENVINI